MIWFGRNNETLYLIGFLVAAFGMMYGPLMLLGKWWIPQYPLRKVFRGQSGGTGKTAEPAHQSSSSP